MLISLLYRIRVDEVYDNNIAMGLEWWQIVLILLTSIVVGIVGGVLLSRLTRRFAKKRKAASVVKEQLKSTMSDLLVEVKNNLKIATEPGTNKLLPFQTQVWDVCRYEIGKLPGNHHQDLEQAYIDIRLANSIVWLSTEFSRRTPNLDENYMKLCTSITGRLDRVRPLIEGLVK